MISSGVPAVASSAPETTDDVFSTNMDSVHSSEPRSSSPPPSKRRNYWSPRLANSPKHEKGKPSPRTSPKRTPRAMQYSAALILHAAVNLFPVPGSKGQDMLPKTRVLNVLDQLPLPNHLLGTLKRIAVPANSDTCRCEWRSYGDVHETILGRGATDPISQRQVINHVAELEAYGVVHTRTRQHPKLGNLPNSFTVQVPPRLLELATEYAREHADHLAALAEERAKRGRRRDDPPSLMPDMPGDLDGDILDPLVEEAGYPGGEPLEEEAEDDQAPDGVGAAPIVGEDAAEARAAAAELRERTAAAVEPEAIRARDGSVVAVLPSSPPASALPIQVFDERDEAFIPAVSRPAGAPPPRTVTDPSVVQGAILELLRAHEDVYRHLPVPLEEQAGVWAQQQVHDLERSLRHVLTGLYECSTKPGRRGDELVSFAAGCIRVAAEKDATPPKPVKRILRRAAEGKTAASLTGGARAPPRAPPRA